MADDVKIQLGIDVEALQRSAAQATNILSKTFEQQNLSPNLLGSGIGATQLPPAQQGSRDTLRGVIDALERVERTLVTGFTSVTGGSWLSGGAGGGGGGPPRGTDGRFLPKDEEDAAESRRRASRRSAVGYVSHGIDALGAYASSGGSAQGVTQLVGAAASMLAPELAPVTNSLMSIFTSAYDKRDTFRAAALTRFQTGGQQGIDADEGGGGGGIDMTRRRELEGLSIERYSDLYANAAKRGAYDQKDERENSNGLMYDLMRTENSFGNSSNVSNMLGAAGRTGSGGGHEETIGAAFSAAVQEGLGKGRMSEIFDQLADAMDKNTKASTDVSATADRFLFISQMGPQYRGDTSASREMDSSIKGLATGSTGYTQMTSLRAAGFGEGKGYFAAKLSLARGVDTKGGVKHEALLKENYAAYVDDYKNADEDGRANIAGMLAIYTHQNIADVSNIMDTLAIESFVKKVNPALGYTMFGEAALMPSGLIAKNIYDAIGQGALKFGSNIGGKSDSGFLEHASALSVFAGAPTSNAPTTASSGPVTSTIGVGATNVPSPITQGSSSSSGTGYQSNDDFIKAYVPSGGAWNSARPAGTPNGSPTDVHQGIDIQNIPAGTMIRCPLDGRVTNSKMGTGNEVGWDVEILLDNGQLFLAEHMIPINKQALTPGKRVYKGQILGKKASGDFGKGIPAHVHIGLRGKDGKPINPAKADFPLQSIIADQSHGDPGPRVSPAGIPLDDSPRGRAEAARLDKINKTYNEVIHKVEVVVSTDHTGRPQARVKGSGPTNDATGGQGFFGRGK